ncbi:MAG: DUF5715 family protein [Terriglobales bacterium]
MHHKIIGLVVVLVWSLTGNATATTTRRAKAGTRKPVTHSKAAKTASTKTVSSTHHSAVSSSSHLQHAAQTSPHRTRHARWNPMFTADHEMLVRQNLELDELELPRIANEDELFSRELNGELVPVEDSDSLVVAANLAENHRYCKPWTRDFLEDLGEAYYQEFHVPIVATSLVRTAEQQRRLRRQIRNAAPEGGATASTHLAGVTVDILKRGMTAKQHAWLEQYLLPLREADVIEPIEERHQPVFHIVVFNTYGLPNQSDEIWEAYRAPQGEVASSF